MNEDKTYPYYWSKDGINYVTKYHKDCGEVTFQIGIDEQSSLG